MPDVNEGLGTPEVGENVNTEDGFEAAMAAKVGRTEELEAREPRVSTSVADGLVEAGTPQARAEDGRFTAEPEDEVEEEETPAEDEEEETPSEEEEQPEPDAWQIRYEEAQKVIGRQGNELGQLREEVAKLSERVTNPQPAAQPFTLRGEELQDAALELIEEHGEAQAAIIALNSDPSETLYRAVMKSWGLEDSFAATDFHARKLLIDQEAKARAQQGTAPAPDEWVEAQKSRAAINTALATVQAESKDWDLIAPHMTAALEQVPARVAAMIGSADPEERLDGTRIVATHARLLAGSQTTAAAKAKEAEAGTARKKAAARVASGSMRPVAPPGSGNEEQTSEERIAAFKKELMATETTSVQEGLTYAKS